MGAARVRSCYNIEGPFGSLCYINNIIDRPFNFMKLIIMLRIPTIPMYIKELVSLFKRIFNCKGSGLIIALIWQRVGKLLAGRHRFRLHKKERKRINTAQYICRTHTQNVIIFYRFAMKNIKILKLNNNTLVVLFYYYNVLRLFSREYRVIKTRAPSN